VILIEGNKGERVEALQQALKNKGFDPSNSHFENKRR
jgi:peptidoglycan hydrolase-like protein with peptidoglycan-binding domain